MDMLVTISAELER